MPDVTIIQQYNLVFLHIIFSYYLCTYEAPFMGVKCCSIDIDISKLAPYSPELRECLFGYLISINVVKTSYQESRTSEPHLTSCSIRTLWYVLNKTLMHTPATPNAHPSHTLVHAHNTPSYTLEVHLIAYPNHTLLYALVLALMDTEDM